MDRRDRLRIGVPGDKSVAQRALILAAMASGESRIADFPRGADPLATAAALRGLGVSIGGLDAPDAPEFRIAGRGLGGWLQPPAALDLRNSGTGARLLAGALAAQPLDTLLTGDASLSARPMNRIAEPLRRMGAQIDFPGRPGCLPMRVRGGALRSIQHRGRVASAQVKSAILLAAVGAGVPVEIHERARSRDHTERMLRAMGAVVEEGWDDDLWTVRLGAPPDRLLPLATTIPGDFSSAAFLLAWAALTNPGEPLEIHSVGLNPTRTGLLPLLERMGVRVEVEPYAGNGAAEEPVGTIRVLPSPSRELLAVEVAAEELPGLIDEVPVLAVLAARAHGVTRIAGAAELRVKESDRLAALTLNLRAIGVEVEEFPDGLAIRGTPDALAGQVQSFHDHRMAMAFGVLGATPGCRIAIDDPSLSDVSFPGFHALLARVQSRLSSPPQRLPSPPGARCLVVAIDGSAGAGKSTTAAAVAARLGFRHLDSGALYRAVTLALLRSPRGLADIETITAAELDVLGFAASWSGVAMELCIGGEAIADADLRSDAVTAAVSRVAAVPAVRRHLLGLQREAAIPPGLVAEGRDMATVIFPDARLGIYLDARPTERARRRLLQRGAATDAAAIEREAGRLQERDRLDSTRATAPLSRAPDSITIDTTDLDPGEQIEAVVRMVLPLTEY